MASEGRFRRIPAVSVSEATFLPDFGAAAHDDRLPNHADRRCSRRQGPIGYATERALNAASLLASSWAINSLPRAWRLRPSTPIAT